MIKVTIYKSINLMWSDFMVWNSYCLYLNLSFRECKDIVSFSLSFLLKARNMVVINENGEVIFKKIKWYRNIKRKYNKYSFIEHKECFNKFINLLLENYLIYWIIKSLEYKIKLIWQYVIDEKTRIELP